MSANILPEDYRQAVEARSVEEVLGPDVYFTAPQKSEEDILRVIGRCRIIADSVDELRRIDHAAQALEPVGIRLVLDGPGISLDNLPALSREIRQLPSISIRGCFVQGDTAGLHGEALGRYYRSCYEAAKRMSAILPCGVAFLCVTGGGRAAERNAQEYPETLPEFLRAAEIVAAQNRSAFYAKLLVT